MYVFYPSPMYVLYPSDMPSPMYVLSSYVHLRTCTAVYKGGGGVEQTILTAVRAYSLFTHTYTTLLHHTQRNPPPLTRSSRTHYVHTHTLTHTHTHAYTRIHIPHPWHPLSYIPPPLLTHVLSFSRSLVLSFSHSLSSLTHALRTHTHTHTRARARTRQNTSNAADCSRACLQVTAVAEGDEPEQFRFLPWGPGTWGNHYIKWLGKGRGALVLVLCCIVKRSTLHLSTRSQLSSLTQLSPTCCVFLLRD